MATLNSKCVGLASKSSAALRLHWESTRCQFVSSLSEGFLGCRRVLASIPAPPSGVSAFYAGLLQIRRRRLLQASLLPPFLILTLVAFGFVVVFISSLPVDIERSCDISMGHQGALSFKSSALIHRKIRWSELDALAWFWWRGFTLQVFALFEYLNQ